MSELPEIDWEARLRAAVEETLRRAAARRVERAELKARRNVGLQRRHAQKLAAADALVPQANPGGQMPDQPPCCAGQDERCPQHQQHARESWNKGPRSRSGAAQRVIGESGRARPAPAPEEER
jgi:hypothetical protein